MRKRKHVTAVFTTSENVSQFLTDASTFYTAISTAPGSTYVTIPAATMTAAQAHITTARAAETAVGTGTMGLASARDMAVAVVETDVRNFTATVQIAANNAVDATAATTVITECGLVTKRAGSITKNSFAVKLDPATAGVLDFTFKAAARNVKASYEIQQSTDNMNWVTVKVSPDSQNTYAHGMISGTKLYFRGRIILSEKKGAAQEWLTPPSPFVYTI